MNRDYIEKLVSDIQQYLNEEEQEEQVEQQPSAEAESTAKSRARRTIMVGVIVLLSACAVGSITVAILLLGIVGSPLHNPVDTILLLTVGGCGLFFATMLVSVWKRLLILQRIEENTRLILESKQRANELLEHYIRSME